MPPCVWFYSVSYITTLYLCVCVFLISTPVTLYVEVVNTIKYSLLSASNDPRTDTSPTSTEALLGHHTRNIRFDWSIGHTSSYT